MKRSTPTVSFTTVKKLVVSLVFAANQGVALAAEDAAAEAAKVKAQAKANAEAILEAQGKTQERSDKESCRIQAERIEELETKASTDCEQATFRTDTDTKKSKKKSKDEDGNVAECAQRIVNCMGAADSYEEPEKPEANPLNSVLSQFPQFASTAQFLNGSQAIDTSNDKRCPTLSYEKYVDDQKRLKQDLDDLDKKIKEANKDLDEAKKDNNEKNKDAAKANKDAQKEMSDRKTDNAKEQLETSQSTQKSQADLANQISEKQNDIIKAQNELLQRQQTCQKMMSSYNDSLLKTKCYAEMVKAKKALEESGVYGANSFNSDLTNTLRAAYKQCRADGRKDFLDKEANCNTELRGGAKSIQGIQEQIAGFQQSIEQKTADLQATVKRLQDSNTEADQVYKQTLQEQIAMLQTANTELQTKTQQNTQELQEIEKKKADIKFQLQTMGSAPKGGATKSWEDAKGSMRDFSKRAVSYAYGSCCTSGLANVNSGLCARKEEFKATSKVLNGGRSVIPAEFKIDVNAPDTGAKPVVTADPSKSKPAGDKASTNSEGPK